MRRWGLLITGAYVVILLCVIVPAGVLLAGPASGAEFISGLADTFKQWMSWFLIGVLVIGQASLLFLSVDTSHRRLRPRAHVLVSCSVAAILTALLISGVVCSLGVAARGDKFGGGFFDTGTNILLLWGGLWLLWGAIFYLYCRNSSQVVTQLISWLLKGSVLELLVAVPCHIIVRRRHDCSAPVITSFGITTGVAIMLLSFGPSILLLYKKRLEAYATHEPA